MSNPEPTGRYLRIDPAAVPKDSTQPPFVSKPDGAPVYYGFPIVPESETGGWFYGAITDFEDPLGCKDGDGYVVAPDGSRAGLIWEVGEGKISEVLPPDDERWGVYAAWFQRPIMTVEDLVFNFRAILPDLTRIYESLS